MRRIAAASALVILLACLTALPQDAAGDADTIFNRIEDTGGSALPDDIRALEALGRAALPDVRKALTRANPFVRIAAAKFLYSFDMRDEGLEALSKVVAGKNAAAKRLAADYVASLVGLDDGLTPDQKRTIAGDLIARAREVDDELARIHLWRAVHSLKPTIQPKRELKDILRSAKEAAVRHEAALALAAMDSFSPDVSGALKELAKEPGERGRLARAFLKMKRLQDDIERHERAAGAKELKRDYSLLEEIIDKLHAQYYDEDKIDDDKLIEAAADGLCASLDPYTAYYNEERIRQLTEDVTGEYGGIGARVSMMRDKQGNTWLTIVEPIFSGPAYLAGMRSNDRIVEVEGEPTVNQELTDLVKKLRGKPGTKVKFKAYRQGWEKPRDMEIVRARVRMETTMHRMLPGKIGYLHMTTFGKQDVEGVKNAIKEMEGKGMKALVFDLRGNPGGYLATAERITDYFLAPGQLIVSTRARGKVRNRRVSREPMLTDIPVIVMINGQSASASEIIAGALKDHGRATLVGERTFGKGSVQDIKYLGASNNRTALRVTIAKWHLPGGASVESDDPKVPGGVEPHIKIEIPERDFWKDSEFERIRAGTELSEYLNEQFPKHKDLFYRLAETDDR
ncbi:MAG: S41 family peptidase, partial [Planctomycetota bacterium]